MTPQLTIFGAGLSGLIAARMLSDRHPLVCEAQPSLPNNHHALLRFRSSVVGDATNVAFKKVQVSKWILREKNSNPIRDSAIYARKVTGKMHARSILDTRLSERYIAPKDFIQRLASTANFSFVVDFQSWSHNLSRSHGPVISTIPVPTMMALFRWPDAPDFQHRNGWTVRVRLKPSLECQLNGTIYSARDEDLWYRASMTEDVLIVEGAGELPPRERLADALAEAGHQFGLCDGDVEEITVHEAKYQKIAELDSRGRETVKRFLMWLSQEHQIYSLGRYAVWRPKLLLDDLVNDVRVIARLIDGESLYNELKA